MRIKPQRKVKNTSPVTKIIVNRRASRTLKPKPKYRPTFEQIFAKKASLMSTEMELENSSPEAGEFTTVENKRRRTTDITKIFAPTTSTVPVIPSEAMRNRFTALGNEQSNEAQTTTGNTAPIKKPKMPPPVVMHQRVTDHKNLIKFITEMIGTQFHIKHVAGRTAIQAHEYGKYKILLRELTANNLQCHTYTPAEEKTHGFVIRGLDSNPEPEEIQESLNTEHKLEITKVYKMKTNFRPLFLVITNKEVNLRFLQENIKYVCRTRIKWERHVNSKQITQCRRCQEWGHATSNCFATPRCAHCAAEHWTHQCTTKENSKCVNCDREGHKAFSTECPIYIKRLALTKKSEPPKYIDAPAPKTNAWQLNTLTATETETAAFPHPLHKPHPTRNTSRNLDEDHAPSEHRHRRSPPESQIRRSSTSSRNLKHCPTSSKN